MISLGTVQIDLEGCTVVRPDKTLPLTPRERALIVYFARSPGRAIPLDEFKQELWGYAAATRTRAPLQAIYRLRQKLELDPERPRWIVSASGGGYRWEGPPLPSDPTIDHDLPCQLAAIIGRGGDLDALGAALRDSRFVTVVGPPGVGKTRLAIAKAWDLLEALPGGAWFVDLAAVRDATSACVAVARVLAVELRTKSSAPIGHALRYRGPALLILDNLEQIVEEASDLVSAWLSRAPDLRILATSRQAIGVAGERVVPLAPLGPEDAVALFLERARASRGDLDAPPEVVEEIVDRLDGIPLAIELAAARVGLFSVATLARRLRSSLDVLVSTRRTAERHSTLWNSIAWSWGLLEADERHVAAALSVFRGGCTLDAAHAVVAPADQVALDVILQSLIDKHLLIRGEHAGVERLRYLPFIQAYADGQLTGRARRDVRQRHRAYFGDFSEALRGADRTRAERRALEGELDNLLSAIETGIADRSPADASRAALAVVERTEIFGGVRDLLANLAALWDLPGMSDPMRFEIAHAIARLRVRLADADEAWIRRASALAEGCGDARMEARSAALAGVVRMRAGRYAEAHEAFEAAIQSFQRTDDGYGLSLALSNRGIVYGSSGAHEDAEACLRWAIDAAHTAGSPLAEGIGMANLGLLLSQRDRAAEAREALIGALERFRANGHTWREGQALVGLGELASRGDRLDEAERWFSRALAAHRQVGDAVGAAIVTGELGCIDADRGRHQRAHERLDEALDGLDGRDLIELRAKFSDALAATLVRLGRTAEARDALDRVEALLAGGRWPEELVVLWCRRAEVEAAASDPIATAAAATRARSFARGLSLGVRTRRLLDALPRGRSRKVAD